MDDHTWIAFAQLGYRRRLLLLTNLFILLLVGSRLEALPRKPAAQEIHKHVTQCLEVIPP